MDLRPLKRDEFLFERETLNKPLIFKQSFEK